MEINYKGKKFIQAFHTSGFPLLLSSIIAEAYDGLDIIQVFFNNEWHLLISKESIKKAKKYAENLYCVSDNYTSFKNNFIT